MTRQNVTFSIGSIALIDKADAQTGFFKTVFGGLGGRAKDFIPAVKLLMVNKLEESVAIHRLLDFMPMEKLSLLGFRKGISDRTLNRTLERLGENSKFVIDKYQKWVKENKLDDKIQNVDFSSSYFEGNECTLAKLGYSRDHQPGKPQITYGISIGANRIPTALTIQKGNINDRKHMKKMLKLCTRILVLGSLLVFDCGGNTKRNKIAILKLGFNYLTLKGKKVGPYKEAVAFFRAAVQEKIENPYLTGIEGFFILESSLDLEASELLRLYREKDVVEKFIRDLKEGAEMRPIRHWSDDAVIGYVLLVFLTNALVNLTQYLAKSPVVKNLKVLKKYLNNLTVSVIYPKGWFKMEVITNFSAELVALFGDFLKKYGQIELQIWR